MGDKIEVYICYAREDVNWLRELEHKLSTMERQGLINILHDLKVAAGSEYAHEINKYLKAAQIILLLVSSDFIASEQCYGIAERAIEKQKRKEARVIPILLHETDWEYAIFGQFAPLPTNRRPISSWADRNAAFLDVVKGIRKVVEELSAPPSQSSVAPAPEPGNSSPGKETHMPQASTPKGKQEFDVFLCHNSKDKPEVKRIAELLKAQGIVPWLDEWELRPGLPWQRALEEQIENIKSAAVFVGSNGRGPWQDLELEAFIREFVNRGCPVIPVVLEDAPDKPQLPPFLRGMTWVDFRVGDPDPMERLVWGITGRNPFGDNYSGSGVNQNIANGPPGNTTPRQSTNMKPDQSLMQMKRKTLVERYERLAEKIAYFEKEFDDASDADVRRTLKIKIERERAELAEVEAELRTIQ